MDRSFIDWLDNVLNSAVESITCSDRYTDPAEIVSVAEQRLIKASGYNLNHQYVTLNPEE